MATIFKTIDNQIIADSERLPDTFIMIGEQGNATWVEFKDGLMETSKVNDDILAIVEGRDLPQPKKAVTYIATVIEYGHNFEFKVLSSRARSSEPAGRNRDFEQGRLAVEKKYGNVTWVSPYRFSKELTAC